MKRILVVIDMQNDFVSGSLGSKETRAVVPAVESLIAKEKGAGAEIVFTKDTHGADYSNTQEGRLLPVPHCLKGGQGWEIVPELQPHTTGARVFEKGAFGSLALAEYIRDNGFKEITLCGVCTDICVISNALLIKAYCPESTVRVVSGACAGTSEEGHNAALAAMRSCQVNVE